MRKRTSCPTRSVETQADTAPQVIARVLTAAMSSWAAALRLAVVLSSARRLHLCKCRPT